jgi:hypothetical protein
MSIPEDGLAQHQNNDAASLCWVQLLSLEHHGIPLTASNHLRIQSVAVTRDTSHIRPSLRTCICHSELVGATLLLCRQDPWHIPRCVHIDRCKSAPRMRDFEPPLVNKPPAPSLSSPCSVMLDIHSTERLGSAGAHSIRLPILGLAVPRSRRIWRLLTHTVWLTESEGPQAKSLPGVLMTHCFGRKVPRGGAPAIEGGGLSHDPCKKCRKISAQMLPQCHEAMAE